MIYNFKKVNLNEKLDKYQKYLIKEGIGIEIEDRLYENQEICEIERALYYVSRNNSSDLAMEYSMLSSHLSLIQEKTDFEISLSDSWGLSDTPGGKEIAIYDDGNAYIEYTYYKDDFKVEIGSDEFYYPNKFLKELEKLSEDNLQRLHAFIKENELLVQKENAMTFDWGATLKIKFEEIEIRRLIDSNEYDLICNFLVELLNINFSDIKKEMIEYGKTIYKKELITPEQMALIENNELVLKLKNNIQLTKEEIEQVRKLLEENNINLGNRYLYYLKYCVGISNDAIAELDKMIEEYKFKSEAFKFAQFVKQVWLEKIWVTPSIIGDAALECDEYPFDLDNVSEDEKEKLKVIINYVKINSFD